MEKDLSPRFGGVGSHEGVPGGRGGEEVDEGGVAGVAEPGAPDVARLELAGQLVAAAVVSE